MTALFTADELAHATGGVMTHPFHATGVSIDTRTIQPGDVFIALHTRTGDGHTHVGEALHKGAAGALVQRQEGAPDDASLLIVHDTLTALTALGGYARERFEGAVVAVTGSVGKTTTKEMLRTMLSACGRTHAAHASYNNHWGVPLTLARMPPDAAYAVIEIGMNNPGEIAPLARLASPDVAVITTVEATHIGHLGSLDAIADEKASIMQGLLQGGSAVLPSAHAQFARLAARVPPGARIVTFGPENILMSSEDADGTEISATIAGTRQDFRVGAPGRHMVMNALAALTAAACLGADVSVCAAALASFHPVSGRGARRKLLGGAAILLDESYNASAASVRAALSVLKLQPARRRIAVLGDMLELGDFSQSEHANLAGVVADSADLLYACGPWMKFLYDAVPSQQRGAYAADSLSLAPVVRAAVRAGDAVLVKGSFGSRMDAVVDELEALEAGHARGNADAIETVAA
jgi:UDP-N-acetylmuramoyl-tripeptide--D-alanyl-D-alanine ligase